MNDKLFKTYEVGSLPKPSFKVKAFSRQQILQEDINELRSYSKKIGFDASSAIDYLIELKGDPSKLSADGKKLLNDTTALLYIRLQEYSGLDFIYDGEARRGEMYWNVAKHIDGFEPFPEWIRSRGPDSWRRCDCVHEPGLLNSVDSIIGDEFDFIKDNANNLNSVKVPIDDPYMITMMSSNSHYLDKLENLEDKPSEWIYQAQRELNLALAENVIRPQVEHVIKQGAKWIQLDAPGATNEPLHIPIFIEGINKVVEGINEDVKFSIHICYPKRKPLMDETGYGLFYRKNPETGNPHFLDLSDKIDHLSLEFANADILNNGDSYKKDLAPFKEHWNDRKFQFGLGVIDITWERQENDLMETPEQVAQRILIGAELFGEEYIFPAPDCGMRQLSLERCVELYEILVEGAELARKG